MRGFLILCFFLFALRIYAQDTNTNEDYFYQLALERIEEARLNGAKDIYLPPELTVLPPEIGTVVTLETLNLNYGQLESLPPEIGNLLNLKVLLLFQNDLRSLPPEIGNLTQLRVLNAHYNRIESLPPEIGNLQNLEVLNLNANLLTELPPEIGQLSNLCMLWIADNQIQRLPVEMGNLSGLLTPDDCPAVTEFHLSQDYGLNIDNLPLIYPPNEILAQGDNAVILYLQNETGWYLKRWLAGGASGLGLVAAVVLGWRWKNRRGKEKEKRG
jgi:Leucine-rich repeat (LRR) protein